MISVLILTMNEEDNLPGALASVAWSDDIHVLDSGSTDRTCQIAEAAGARVTIHPFTNWAAHQNWALSNLPFRHPWVFYLDADERVTPTLRDTLLAAAASPGPHVAFHVQRRDFLDGRWLRHVQTTPFYLRLFRPERMRYERLVNPVSISNGPTGYVAGFLDHYPFSKGIADWFDRHNRYSTLEAQQILSAPASRPSLSAIVREPDFTRRRALAKQLFYRLPARPLLKFVFIYFLKRGFLDGSAGLRYAILQSLYEYQIVLKTRELHLK